MNELYDVQPNINDYLKHRSEWSEKLAMELAERQNITLTEKHWNIIHYLRTEFYSNSGVVPLMHELKLCMEQLWGTHVTDHGKSQTD